MASFVENIRVSRFVMEGFSDAVAGCAKVDFCGSGGAAFPLLLRLSVLGIAIPLALEACVSGDPTAEFGCEVGGEVRGFAAICESLFVLTVAMVGGIVRLDAALGTGNAKNKAAEAVRAMPWLRCSWRNKICERRPIVCE